MLTNIVNGVEGEVSATEMGECYSYSDTQSKTLYICDDCCGVALPNMVGKLVGKVVQIAAFG